MKKIIPVLLLFLSLVSGCSASVQAENKLPGTSEAPTPGIKLTAVQQAPLPSPKLIENQSNFVLERLLYDVYPDTDAAPVLEFYWEASGPKLSQIISAVPYGVWQGQPGKHYQPSVGIGLSTTTSHDPVMAVAAGTIVEVNDKNNSISVRYGKIYGITYHDVVDFPDNVRVGIRVEPGNLLGYTAKRDGAGWWGIEMDIRRRGLYRTVPPFSYFSPESQQNLQPLLLVSQWNFSGSTRNWTVTDGDAWTVYTIQRNRDSGNSWLEWWASSHRLGYELEILEETENDFLTVNNLLWVLSNPVKPPDPETIAAAPDCH